MPPLISIIIPAYNVADYLPACMDSLLPDAGALGCEVVLADDGSADGTGALCDEYAAQHPFVRTLHQANAGQSAARNAAIRAAAGEWLVFVDSDDLLAPGALRKIDATLRREKAGPVSGPDGANAPGEHNQTDVPGGPDGAAAPGGAGGVPAAPGDAPAATGIDLLLYNSRSTRDNAVRSPFLTAQFAGGMAGYLARAVRDIPFVAAPWRYAVRRAFLVENGLWFHEGIYHEDCEWCPKLLARAAGAAVCEQPLYIYRDADDGRESTLLSPARRAKRLVSLAAVAAELQKEAARFASDETRRIFLLRCAALAEQQRLELAAACGTLAQAAREDQEALRALRPYLPRRFALCVRLAGPNWGTRLFRRLWKNH